MNKLVLFRTCCLMFIAFCIKAMADPSVAFSQLKFKHLTINQGLSQNAVLCMVQDKQGFIWIGTEDGLNRYDGYEFRHYKRIEGDKTSISNGFINAIAEDEHGNLWIGTADGLNYYDKKKDQFTRIETISAASKRLNREFISMLFLSGENLWMGTIEGIKRYNRKEKKLYQISENKTGTTVNLDNRPEPVFKDANNTLWIGYSKGLSAYNLVTGAKLDLPKSIAALSKEYIRAIKQDFSGNIWFASERNGIFIYNPQTRECNSCKTQTPILPGMTIRDVFFKEKGEVWIGTMQGLYVQKNGDFTRYSYKPGEETGLK